MSCMQAWRLGLGFPIGSAIIAALGFVLAAMWIDTIATELVSMLEYLGLLSGISHTVRPSTSLLAPHNHPCLVLTARSAMHVVLQCSPMQLTISGRCKRVSLPIQVEIVGRSESCVRMCRCWG